MVLVVNCLICKKELNYSQGDSSELIHHMKKEHPLLSKSGKNSEVNLQGNKREIERDMASSLSRNSKALQKLIDEEVQTEINSFNCFALTTGEYIH